MEEWPQAPSAGTFAVPTDYQAHRLDVYLAGGQLTDVRLDGESVLPTWFKIEWKENGEVSAKVKGVRLATRFGDEITIHQAQAMAMAQAR